MQLASYAGEEVDLDAALVQLVADGAWALERQRLADGLAALKAGTEVSPRDLKVAEEAFRRERGLLSGEDLARWLSARELKVADLRAHLQVGLAAAEAAARAQPPPPDEVREAARRAVLLSGLAIEGARQLVAGAAALDVVEHKPAAPPTEEAGELARRAADDTTLPLENRDLAYLHSLAERVLLARVALAAAHQQMPDREVEGTLAEHRVEWTELEFSELRLPTEQAAREAVLCLSEDHLELAEVGALAGAAVQHRSCPAGQLGPPLEGHLLACQPGAAVGPLRTGDVWSVAVLHRRRAPSVEDEAARRRALEIAVRKRLDRRLAGRVKWYDAAV